MCRILPTRLIIRRAEHSLDTLIPNDPHKPYDMKELITKVVDEGDFFDIQEGFAKNIVTGFARFGGYPVGIVANQPMMLAGVLDSDASRKAARFVRFCDCFNLPIVTFVDVPGFLPGTAQEYGGLIKHGAKLLFAFAEATVPKVTVITRKAYGGAYDVMSSKHIGGRRQLCLAERRDRGDGLERRGGNPLSFGARRQGEDRCAHKEYRTGSMNPFIAAERGYIDEVIMPHSDTRYRVARALNMLRKSSGDAVEEARQHPAMMRQPDKRS